jgi:hypothetical protein
MISILCPTRRREKELIRMVQSVRDTATGPVEVVAYVDDDDPISVKVCDGLKIKHKVGPRQLLTQCWNELLPLAEGDILMQGNDDIIFRTKGWDQMVEEAFATCGDKILMVHGSDLAPGAMGKDKFGPHPFVHRRWVNVLGYFIAPYFSSDYGDTWLNDIANILGRRLYLPFEVEHMHYIFGKAKFDTTSAERMNRHHKDDVDGLYKELLPKRLQDVEKLRVLMNTPDIIWTIMILTQPSRNEFLTKLVRELEAQTSGKPIEIAIRTFDPELSLGGNREEMRRAAKGQYISFVDDDDAVSKNFVGKILPVLQKGEVDYVGFQLQCYVDGRPLEPTFHSLKYKSWYSDAKGHYRHISHINPIRKDLALLVSMEGGHGEDHRWSDALYVIGRVTKEYYVDEVMYHYLYRSVKSDGVDQHHIAPHNTRAYKPPVEALITCLSCGAANTVGPRCRRCSQALSGQPRQSNWRPSYMMCPDCKSTCVVVFSNGLRCNQCGLQFK